MRPYENYLCVRDNSWECLIKSELCSLPIDIIKIARREEGIKVIKNSSVKLLRAGENGRSFYDGSTWCIIYNDLAPIECSRYTIAHELGHYYLEHEIKYSQYWNMRTENDKYVSEKYADMFARRILCPSCVLWGMGITSCEYIAKYCMVERHVAEERARRMQLLYSKDKFLTDPCEQKLYSLFSQYIKEHSTVTQSEQRI
ncbi:MAG: ImmA/IrrE family metallo-endopeptidase [Clostridia bacterium]|nr:ImmA/IrrE family metallo-endopeptidase [Clostridia bacterium]